MPKLSRKKPDPKNPPPFYAQGLRLTSQRQVLNLSQGEVAEACGVTIPSVQQWEYGATSPRPGKWPNLEKKLLRPRIWFMTGQETPQNGPKELLAARQAISMAIQDMRKRLDYLEALCGAHATDAKVEQAGYIKVKTHERR
jgi:transcriptional regulator with XRE-family HTH domain